MKVLDKQQGAACCQDVKAGWSEIEAPPTRAGEKAWSRQAMVSSLDTAELEGAVHRSSQHRMPASLGESLMGTNNAKKGKDKR
jgi:hypothetical protein